MWAQEEIDRLSDVKVLAFIRGIDFSDGNASSTIGEWRHAWSGRVFRKQLNLTMIYYSGCHLVCPVLYFHQTALYDADLFCSLRRKV